jgi:hypothetical protein
MTVRIIYTTWILRLCIDNEVEEEGDYDDDNDNNNNNKFTILHRPFVLLQ